MPLPSAHGESEANLIGESTEAVSEYYRSSLGGHLFILGLSGKQFLSFIELATTHLTMSASA